MKLKLQENRLYFWPVSGAGQIGRNFNLYGFAGEWIVVDWGVSFNQGQGVDVVFPDYTVLHGLKKNLKACLLTHAHEDHVGALPYFWKDFRLPIYATPFTAAMVEYQFKANGIDYEPSDINVVDLQKDINICKNFTARFIPLNHSIPDAAGIYIKTPEVKIFHTGDWRIDPNPVLGKTTTAKDFEAVKKEGVDLLVCDSTNVNTSEHIGSETQVGEELKNVFNNHKKQRLFVTCFASNIERIISIGAAARKTKRKICLLGRSFGRTHSIAQELGYLKDFPEVVTPQEAADLPDHKVAFVCSGSQGEARASLSTMAAGKHRFLSLKKNDLIVFSSRNIPGNEKRISELKNALELSGARVLSNVDDRLLHVSGHPSRADLEKMYTWIEPKMLLPVHGEFYHLAEHTALGNEKKIISEFTHNGHLYECSADSLKNVMRADVRVFGLDGKRTVSMDSRVFGARERLSNHGVLSVAVSRGSLNQMLHYGLWEDATLDAELRAVIERVLSNCEESHSEVVARIKGDVGQWLRSTTGKNPAIIVLVQAWSGARRGSGGGRRRKPTSQATFNPNSVESAGPAEAVQDDIGNVKESARSAPAKKGNHHRGRKKESSGNVRDPKESSGNVKDPYAEVMQKYNDE